MEEELTIDIATTDIKGLARYTTKLWDYVTSQAFWDMILEVTIKIAAILVISYLVVLIGKKVIARVFMIRVRNNERRQVTIVKLLQSVLSYLVYFSMIMGILSALNIQIAGLIAGAGIASVAIAFGAQNLVKDIITGFFIILEDQFSVGDYVRIGAAEGTVIEIGLRTTKLKGTNGEQFILPNGSIAEVINYSINNSKAMIDMQVALDANIEKVQIIIQDYLDTLPSQHEELVSAPLFLGVTNTTSTEATIRITVETLPLQQFAISRVIRKDVIDILTRNGIPLAVPKMMFYDKGGE
ncbi:MULTISPECIES: mechanosensitive ion channel family protein [Solibacillus]|uniref:Mechanosensitive ion channel family protein n=1 Tax=Solibacillus palustris TaxID=2908203 RepID=A0ABS9UH43_9BACL|nr:MULTISPECIES: mechanosensitive ion channel family protein [Solibacillus]MCH7323475.1 mechanosensitive ion channel family protein [Solibacillus sp. MA9]